MQAYTGFAEIYDLFMDNVPYDRWEQVLSDLLAEQGVRDGLVLELGCGTGEMTERMAARGYDMIGLDLSEDMLAEAALKRSESGQNILYLNQDMREFELYGTVAAVYSICDSLNYIVEEEDMIRVFRLVNNYLDPAGVFVFDFTTPAEYRSPLRRHPILDEKEGITMIWENEYREEQRLNEHRITVFLPVEPEPLYAEDCGGMHEIRRRGTEDESEPLYVKWEEIHEQRGWTPEEIRRAAEAAGMRVEKFLDADSGREPEEESTRVFCVLREQGKTNQ